MMMMTVTRLQFLFALMSGLVVGPAVSLTTSRCGVVKPALGVKSRAAATTTTASSSSSPIETKAAWFRMPSTAAAAVAAVIGWNVFLTPALALDDGMTNTMTPMASSETETTVAVAAQQQPEPSEMFMTEPMSTTRVVATTATTFDDAAVDASSSSLVREEKKLDTSAAAITTATTTATTTTTVVLQDTTTSAPSPVVMAPSEEAITLAATTSEAEAPAAPSIAPPTVVNTSPVIAAQQDTAKTTANALQEQQKALASTSSSSSSSSSYDMILTSAPRAAVLSTEYADPLHPYCRRRIEVASSGKTFRYIGTSVVGPKDDSVLRGCSPEEQQKFKLKSGEFKGRILLNPNENTLVVSAGDGIHEGVWEPKNTARTKLGYEDLDGIRWQDGNKWVVQSQASVQRNGKDGSYRVVKRREEVALQQGVFGAYVACSMVAAAVFYTVIVPQPKPPTSPFYED